MNTETMTKPATTIRKSVFLATDAETVWAHLTDPELLGKWFNPATAPLARGQDFTLVSRTDASPVCWGKVVEMRAPDHMVWDFSVRALNGQKTRVEWRIDTAAGGVRLSLEHSGLPETTEAFDLILGLDKGWHGFLLELRSQTDA